MSNRFYITTPIYYVNDLPHIGHAYTTIASDVLARYHRMRGEEVRFLMGVDENAQKNVESALKNAVIVSKAKQSHTMAKRSPRPFGVRDDGSVRDIVQKYVDEMAAKWKMTWDELDISNDDFIRTTEPRHVKYVKKFWGMVKKGDIYKGQYEGLYCVGCESYKTEADLVDGKCPEHNRVPEKLSEENYFFKLSAYRDKLLAHIKKHPEFIQPETRRNEVAAYIRDHAQDFSISRKNLEWGIPVPGDPTQTIYVWFDALLNYISANPKWWPADLHLVGKDIIKFHCAYWPAMLMSAGMKLPRTVFAHGFFTVDGQKMSKTLGNVVDPVALAKKYGNDVLRYYVLREIPFGEDGDFSEERLRQRYNGELANGLGNLVARVLTMLEKYAEGRIPPRHKEPPKHFHVWSRYEDAIASLQFDRALEEIWHFMGELDTFIDKEQPWKLAKGDKDKLFAVLYVLAESLRHIGWLLLPFMPVTSQSIFEQLGVGKAELRRPLKEGQSWGVLVPGVKIKKGNALFPRL